MKAPAATEEDLLADVAETAKALTDAHERRDEALRRAAGAGLAHYRLAKVAGLSAPGVAKIVRRPR